MQNSPLPTTDTSQKSLDIKEQLFIYLSYWKWFVLGVLLCLVGVYFYLRYSVPQYGVSATILIKDEKKGGSSELSAFSDLNIFAGKNNVDNEIAILKSKTLSQGVVSELGLDLTYYVEGRVINPELYKDLPLSIQFKEKSNRYYSIDTSFVISPVSNEAFKILRFDKSKGKTYRYGQVITSNLGSFSVEKVANIESFDNDIFVIKSRLTSRANDYSNRVQIVNQNKTNVIQLSIVDNVEQKGIDYLNMLIQKYNEDAVADRNQIAKSTEKFINERLEIITNELEGVEKNAETFKRENRLTNLEEDASLNLSSLC
ncbi:hypothetical protein H9X57_04950 [Flavobacterium piscinae]|uniref:Wzz/FepE/Etk N-terminal domain-containing protein n=1 Tax=Flavobacterium piscinae TaxID=2506424 RepID=UPI001982A62A|nr:Wzz/FepE/Etk N-terminal domain-containing protein [Flavobacterium piscinae]MBC8882971.1 hypothetical protein [Flavobacterium piscinae]